jgi:hypothetical protein
MAAPRPRRNVSRPRAGDADNDTESQAGSLKRMMNHAAARDRRLYGGAAGPDDRAEPYVQARVWRQPDAMGSPPPSLR